MSDVAEQKTTHVNPLLTDEELVKAFEEERLKTIRSALALNAFHAQMGRAAGRAPVRLVHSRTYDVQGEGEV